VPEAPIENSPAIHRWVIHAITLQVPDGTIEIIFDLSLQSAAAL
jgi:hypothetical protein